MFKILNELVEIPINDRLIPADRRTRGGHNQAYKHIRANTTLGQNSFCPPPPPLQPDTPQWRAAEVFTQSQSQNRIIDPPI